MLHNLLGCNIDEGDEEEYHHHNEHDTEENDPPHCMRLTRCAITRWSVPERTFSALGVRCPFTLYNFTEVQTFSVNEDEIILTVSADVTGLACPA